MEGLLRAFAKTHDTKEIHSRSAVIFAPFVLSRSSFLYFVFPKAFETACVLQVIVTESFGSTDGVCSSGALNANRARSILLVVQATARQF